MNEIIKSVVSSQKLSLLIIFITSFFLNTCKENPGEFTLGEEFIESQTYITLIDTFSANLSTVILDTVITSGTESMLIGNYRDNVFGKITSHSYFQIGIPDSLDLYDVQNDDIYDSLNLIIRYNNYFFGDTTRLQRISVHQLTEKIEYEEGGIITSKATFGYNSDPIGSITYLPQPNNSIDTLYIKINDNIGLDLFTKLRNNSEILSDNESFINYFRGLVLLSDDAYEGSIIGFNVDTEDIKLILYTSRVSQTTEKINYDFELENPDKQFNNILHDFSSTQLNPLIEQRNKLPNSETSSLSFLQGGIGLVLRAEFPSLQEILLFNRGLVAKAQLSITPLQGSYNDFDLPPELIIYESDKLNRRNGLVYNSTSTLTIDDVYQEETSYSFDVTEYVKDELADSYVDPEKGLLIILPSDVLNTTFYRLIADAKNQKTKLKIYYLSY